MSKAKPKKVKWTEQMNVDVLECKRRAQDLVSSNNPPRNNNGRKKGYMEVMKEFWELKGYGHFGLKGQNLSDQVSRLERNQEGAVDMSRNDSQGTDKEEYVLISTQFESNSFSNTFSSKANLGEQGRNANQLIKINLHTPAAQLPKEPTALQIDHSTTINVSISDIQGSVPGYNAVDTPTTFTWGRHSDGRTITVKTSTIDDAYNEITK